MDYVPAAGVQPWHPTYIPRLPSITECIGQNPATKAMSTELKFACIFFGNFHFFGVFLSLFALALSPHISFHFLLFFFLFFFFTLVYFIFYFIFTRFFVLFFGSVFLFSLFQCIGVAGVCMLCLS